MNNKLKILWLCYFTNHKVQQILKPLKKIDEIAPWISNMVPLFENNDQVELHIVSQHDWLPRYSHFIEKGIHYHFLRKGMPIIGRHWPGILKFDHWTDFRHLKKSVARIVDSVKPDIIHLHGAENEFCTAITQFDGHYPVFITIQGFIHKSTLTHIKSLQMRKRKELEIIKMFKHFGYRTETMGKDIKAINPDAVLHWHNYPMKKIVPLNVEKKFDVVFFARLSKDKGIEDLLQAVALLKRKNPDISLCVIGGGKTASLVDLARELDIQENIFWAGFLPTQEDVHQLASSARVSVLPTYHDIIPGTIIESLFLNLPVVAYDAGSIHEVNQYDDIISLVEIKNIKRLSEEIFKLLNEENLCNQKASLGYNRALEMFGKNNDEIRQSIINAYLKVIDSFHAGETEMDHL